ncbi:MAG: hypothetical protein WAM66_11055 [Acidobacteriaceae bacterium]
MRRILAIPLLILFILPFALPLFGTSVAEAAVPACCRRNGKHHCMMYMEWSQRRSFTTVREKCPYSIVPPAILVLHSFAPFPSASVFAGVTRHPAVSPQVEAQQRVSFDRTCQKRGPPARIA